MRARFLEVGLAFGIDPTRAEAGSGNLLFG